MKVFRKIFLAVTLICLICTACFGCRILDGKYPMFTPSYSERAYIAPDENAIDKLIAETEKLSGTEGNRRELLKKREELLTVFYEVLTSRTVADIEYYKNTADETLKNRATYIDDYSNVLLNRVLETEKKLFSSAYRSVLIEATSEEYAASLETSETKSDAVLKLEQKESELENEYAAAYKTADGATIAGIYKELIVTRNKIAAEYADENGKPYANYHDYAYAKLYARDYTPEEAKDFRASVLSEIKPLADEMKSIDSSYFTGDRRAGFFSLSEKSLKEISKRVIRETAPETLSSWTYMIDRDLYDFSVSDTKMDTSFVTPFAAYGDGFMFVNAAGNLSDLGTVMHEFGHYNALFATDADKEGNEAESIDLAETHSQAFSLLCLPAVKKVLASEQLSSYYDYYDYYVIFESLWSLLSNSAFEQFEYEVYRAAPENLTESYFNQTFGTAISSYWGATDYSYYEIPHFFQSPAYCVSYSVSLVFASEIWALDNAKDKYLETVSYGAYHKLGDVVSAVGLESPLEPSVVSKVAEKYRSHITDTFAA